MSSYYHTLCEGGGGGGGGGAAAEAFKVRYSVSGTGGVGQQTQRDGNSNTSGGEGGLFSFSRGVGDATVDVEVAAWEGVALLAPVTTVSVVVSGIFFFSKSFFSGSYFLEGVALLAPVTMCLSW